MTKIAFTATSDVARALQTRAAEKLAAGGGIKALADTKSDAFSLNPFAIFVQPGFNVRDFSLRKNKDSLADLKALIAKNGYDRTKPVEVFRGKDGRYYLIGGETRLRAVIELINEGHEIKAIPVIISEGKNDAERTVSMINSNSGTAFDEIELANGVKSLMGFGFSEADIAERLAFPVAKVARLVKVLELPEAILKMIRNEQASVTLALETYRAASSDAEAIEKLKEGLSVAVKAGRSKVTRKHVAGKTTPKKALTNLATDLGSAERTETEEGVTYLVSKEMAERIDAMIAEFKEKAKAAKVAETQTETADA